MRQDWDDLGVLEQLIRDTVKWMLHYVGRVVDVNDQNRKGFVKVMIEELGFDTPDLAIWCEPRQGNALSLPRVGQYAEVYFLGGDFQRPVYLFPVPRMTNNTPANFDGMQTTHVLFEDPMNRESFVVYDGSQGQYEIQANSGVGKIKLLKGLFKFVFGEALDDWIQNILVAFVNTHTHNFTGSGVVGQPTTTITGPSSYLSDNIKGS